MSYYADSHRPIPGELWGYHAAWKRYGVLPWHRLFEPSIRLCEEGFTVTPLLARDINYHEQYLNNSQTTRYVYVPSLNRYLTKWSIFFTTVPLNTIFEPMLGRRRRRWANIGSTLVQRLVFVGGVPTSYSCFFAFDLSKLNFMIEDRILYLSRSVMWFLTQDLILMRFSWPNAACSIFVLLLYFIVVLLYF